VGTNVSLSLFRVLLTEGDDLGNTLGYIDQAPSEVQGLRVCGGRLPAYVSHLGLCHTEQVQNLSSRRITAKKNAAIEENWNH
jgi:hypothetical protein